jgi:predicted ATPase
VAAFSTFIGRDDEAARLAQLIAERRLVTVVGPGGIGKTRLATEIIPRLDEAFPDGIRRCELAPISPRDEIGAEVAGELGCASVNALVLSVGDASCLVVLDNCEHVLRATARLCETLLARCRGLHLLATSREPLGVDGEHLLVLGPLELPATADPDAVAAAPAVRLFADRARAAGARWDLAVEQLAAVAELCRRLDGVPLAIELAAARSRVLSAVELLGHLDRRFELLRRTQSAGSARHGSLRAAIDTSYELLEPGEQTFFRALGVFAGPFSADLAHAVAAPAGADRLDTLDLLSRLVDRSLLLAEQQPGVTRYRLLDSLRHYAADQARAAGEWNRLAGRFVDAMVADADRIVAAGMARWTAEVFGTILTHIANLAAAIETCVAGDETGARAFRLLLPLWGAIHQGRAAEIAALCDLALGRWPEGDEPWRAEATAVALNAYLVDGQVERALGLATALLDRPATTKLARVIALRALGLVAHHSREHETAASHFRAARDAAREAGMGAFERELAVFLVSVVGVGGQLETALATLDDVTALAAREGDPIAEVWARLVRTQLLVGAGRRTDARAALEAADTAQKHFEYPYGRKVGARLRATLMTLDEGWRRSRPLWRAAVDRIASSGDLGELATTLRTAAALAIRDGDRASADLLLAAAPPGTHVTVLPPLFEEELAAGRQGSGVSIGSASQGDALQRVREVLAARGEQLVEAAPGSVPKAPARAALIRAGDGWNVSFAGRTVQVRHAKGLDDLAVLLARPAQNVHCLELIGGSDVSGDAVPGLDDRARREYRTRIRDLQEEIDDARGANDPFRSERAEAELDALVQQLSASFGLSGRSRTTGSAVERARGAVTWRIRAAVKRLGEMHPELGRHLRNTVRTGTWCTYRPETAIVWRLESEG